MDDATNQDLSIKQALAVATSILEQNPDLDSIDIDSTVLLCHVLNCSRSYLYTWPEKKIGTAISQQFIDLIERRALGEPVAYITGVRGFWDFDLNVNNATLIPRPETELLVEKALEQIGENASVLDLGTGSGAIAIVLAHVCPDSEVTAIEQSTDAIAIARENIKKTGINNISLLHGNWFEPLTNQRFDLIVSNPPYIPDEDPHLQMGDVKFEPRSALASGKDGLDDIKLIVSQARKFLKPQGWLLLEHGYDQADSVAKLLTDYGFQNLAQYPDLAGHIRVSGGRIK